MWHRAALGLFVSLLSVFSSPIVSYAKPIAVISENFEFYGDTSERSAIELVESLEAYRGILFSVYNINPGPEYIPVKIYGFKSQSRIEKLTGRDNLGGLYVTSLEGPAFLLTTEGGLKRGKPARQIAYHEYTHHVLAGFSDKIYPRWFNEGFADYLSTFEYNDKKGEFKIGLPSKGRAWVLDQKKWLPYTTVISSIRDYPFKNTGGKRNSMAQSLFYAQSWLAAHYIQTTPGYSKTFTDYVDVINTYDIPETAFEDIMGVSIEGFEAELKAYHKKNRYSYVKASLKKSITIPKATAREISKAELKYHYGEAMRRMIRSEEGRKLAHEFLDEAAKDLGETSQILLSKALLARSESNLDLAKSLIKRALEKNPESRHLQRVAGIIEVEAYKALGQQAGSLKKARKHLITALRAYPDDVTAHYHYAKSFSGMSETPSKQAAASAQSAIHYYRSGEFLYSNMDMAQILERGGKEDLALPVYERALVWSEDPGARSVARRRIKRLKDD